VKKERISIGFSFLNQRQSAVEGKKNKTAAAAAEISVSFFG
jgi:hypothetical protein